MERRAGRVPPGERAGLPAAARARPAPARPAPVGRRCAPTSACRSSAGGWRSAASRPATCARSRTSPACRSRSKTDLRDTYPFGLFASPMEDIVRLHASSGTTGKPIVVAYTEADLRVWTSVMVRTFAACGLHTRRRHPERLRLRPLHGRARRALRRRGARRDGDPDLRRQHRAAAHGAAGLQRHRHLLHALVHAPPRRARRRGGDRVRAGSRWAFSARSPGPSRCAAHIEADARHPRPRHLRPLGDHRPRRRHRVPAAGRAPPLRGPLLPGDRSIPSPASVLPDGAEGELVAHHALASRRCR